MSKERLFDRPLIVPNLNKLPKPKPKTLIMGFDPSPNTDRKILQNALLKNESFLLLPDIFMVNLLYHYVRGDKRMT